MVGPRGAPIGTGHKQGRFDVHAKQNAVATDAAAILGDATVQILTPEEAWETFDEAARYYLHMGDQEFIDAWEAGTFDDDPDRSSVVLVSMLRPVGR